FNAAVAAGGMVLAAMSRRPIEDVDHGRAEAGHYLQQGLDEARHDVSTNQAAVYVAIALSGFCALAGEVIWTRLLGLLFGATVYTFSIILMVFLVGLAAGSLIGSAVSRQVDARVAFGFCQMLLVCAIGWTAHEVSASLPFWPINPSLSSNVAFS